ncbi:hemerythrin domain-containing protein [Candidatus Nitrosocosmicus sp. T]
MSSTENLKNDHITIRRVRKIAQKCSENLYANKKVPLEHIEIISVIIEEFVDNFHHGKEETAYFPETRGKDSFAEEVRMFLIEHELGRRIAKMLRREINVLKENYGKDNSKVLLNNDKSNLNEPVARFLKSYAVFIDDHTGKEDKFFDLIESGNLLSEDEDKSLLKHYEVCKNQVGGEIRIHGMLRLINYLEEQDWMKI